ncbi:hypothetical protein [Curtobacterium sp. GD1]|uniref:hypothetical protein n=1 Tax=Curtobacterium sp. GD1 TaxID=2810612 RepID=UPI001E34E2EF|nr:hypothetical protein [Curtobacterium sp. GD1]MCC8907761.1 hypothetical protein [Curtobacterium sp. GD1]
MTISIHAINARDSGLLNFLYEESGADPSRFQKLVTGELTRLTELLATRGINYSTLKPALVPSRKGRQIVLLYDWLEHKGNYAVAFMNLWMPLVTTTSKFTTKSGDLLGLPRIVSEFEHVVVKARRETFRWDTLYAVYFNNLSSSEVETMHAALSSETRYKGYIDVTFGGEARDFMADTLTFGKIFFNGNVILSHGADDPFVGEEDPLGFPYDEFGFRLTTVIDWYFYPFLDYKIESYSSDGSAEDSILSLAAATGEHVDTQLVPVHVNPDKLDKYLLREKDKLALMTSIGLQEVSPGELAEIITDHLQSNYIYDMRLASDGTPLFAVCAEFENRDGNLTKRLLALKLDRDAGSISLVTMY